MENDFVNPTTNQLLIQPFSAAVFADPDFVITACKPTALALFIPGRSISFLLSDSPKTNIRFPIVAAKPVFSNLLSAHDLVMQAIADDG